MAERGLSVIAMYMTAPFAAEVPPHRDAHFSGERAISGPAAKTLWQSTALPFVRSAHRDKRPTMSQFDLSIVGKPDDEIGISRIAHQYEQASGWFKTYARPDGA